MPAGSSHDAGAVSLPHTWRPLGVRIAATGLFSMLAVVVGFAWFSFDAETRAAFTPFQIATLIALGLLAVSLGFALARSRVVADPDRLVVVNGYRRREYDYAAVVDASLAPAPPGSPSTSTMARPSRRWASRAPTALAPRPRSGSYVRCWPLRPRRGSP